MGKCGYCDILFEWRKQVARQAGKNCMKGTCEAVQQGRLGRSSCCRLVQQRKKRTVAAAPSDLHVGSGSSRLWRRRMHSLLFPGPGCRLSTLFLPWFCVASHFAAQACMMCSDLEGGGVRSTRLLRTGAEPLVRLEDAPDSVEKERPQPIARGTRTGRGCCIDVFNRPNCAACLVGYVARGTYPCELSPERMPKKGTWEVHGSNQDLTQS